MYQKIHTTVAQWIIAISAVGGLVVSAYNVSRIEEVHVLINSRMTELLAITKSASRAEGLKQGEDEARKIPH